MSQEELQRSLEALEAEFNKLQADDSAKERVSQLLADVKQQIQDPDAESDEDVTEVASGLIEQFEMEHPNLTAAINRILLALGDLGI